MAIKIVTALTGFVDGFRTQPFFMGIDVHKHTYHVALRRADGLTHAVGMPASPKALLAGFAMSRDRTRRAARPVSRGRASRAMAGGVC